MDERQYVQGSETTEKFSGKERDTKTGFDYFGARYYHAGLGRWLSVDPKTDDYASWSPYNYVFNNPLGFVDPDGQAPQCPFCGTNTGIRSVMGLMTHLQAYFGDKQAQQALKYSYKTRGEIAVTTLSEPADWAFTAWDAATNGPNWGHALALAPLASSGMTKQAYRAVSQGVEQTIKKADNIKVIGRLEDTNIAKDWKGHEVLDIENWTIRKNDEWIQKGVDGGEIFYIGSPQTKDNLWDVANNRSTVFGRELEQLRSAGYKQVGDYMVPESKLK